MTPALVAVVTGASSGIGAAVARQLAERGWRCVLIARRRERLEELARQLDGEFEVCDVSDVNAVERAASAVAARHSAIGLLVNNAGVAGRRSFFDATPQQIETVTRTNYLGSVWCLRAFRPLLEAGAPSHVVNVVSVAGTVAVPPSGPYAAAKHAQLALSRAAAAELRPRGVHVHTVNPGFAVTEGFPQERLLRTRFARFVLRADDVADAILRAVDDDETEVYVPGWYRAAAIAQAVFPGLTARALSRRGETGAGSDANRR